jgi:hypothetical protein
LHSSNNMHEIEVWTSLRWWKFFKYFPKKLHRLILTKVTLTFLQILHSVFRRWVHDICIIWFVFCDIQQVVLGNISTWSSRKKKNGERNIIFINYTTKNIENVDNQFSSASVQVFWTMEKIYLYDELKPPIKKRTFGVNTVNIRHVGNIRLGGKVIARFEGLLLK